MQVVGAIANASVGNGISDHVKLSSELARRYIRSLTSTISEFHNESYRYRGWKAVVNGISDPR